MSLVWKDHSLACFTGLYYLHCFEFVISAFCAHSCEGCHIVKLKIKSFALDKLTLSYVIN